MPLPKSSRNQEFTKPVFWQLH